MIEVALIPREGVPYIWEEVAPLLKKAIDKCSGYTPESVKPRIEGGWLQLWVVAVDDVLTAAFTTCIQHYPETSECECVHLGGEKMDIWMEIAYKIVERFAKENGCSSLVVMGRKGFEKAWKPLGFEFECVRLKRVIT